MLTRDIFNFLLLREKIINRKIDEKDAFKLIRSLGSECLVGRIKIRYEDGPSQKKERSKTPSDMARIVNEMLASSNPYYGTYEGTYSGTHEIFRNILTNRAKHYISLDQTVSENGEKVPSSIKVHINYLLNTSSLMYTDSLNEFIENVKTKGSILLDVKKSKIKEEAKNSYFFGMFYAKYNYVLNLTLITLGGGKTIFYKKYFSESERDKVLIRVKKELNLKKKPA